VRRFGGGRHYTHGTNYSYTEGKCRCEPCKDAHAAQQRVDKARRLEQGCPSWLHGTETGYVLYGCKCDKCLDAGRSAKRARDQRRRDSKKELESA
jgi:hypothetical protein